MVVTYEVKNKTYQVSIFLLEYRILPWVWNMVLIVACRMQYR